MRSRTEKYSSIILIINSTFLITSHNDILIIKTELDLESCPVKLNNLFTGHVNIGGEVKFMLSFPIFPYDKSDVSLHGL